MDHDKIARVLFADTVNARMLRKLAWRALWSQAEFMREYHVRCERSGDGRSSFGDNFGRYAFERVGRYDPQVRPLGRSLAIPLVESVRRPRELHGYTDHDSMTGRRLSDQVHHWSALLAEFEHRMMLAEIRRGSCALVWRGPTPEALLLGMTPEALAWSFESMERQITVTRASDALVTERTPAEWCVLLQAEITRRSLGGCSPSGIRTQHMHSPRPGVHTIVNGCAQHPLNHLESGAATCGPHPAL